MDAIRKAQELNDLQISKAAELFESLLLGIENIEGKELKISEICEVRGGKRIPKGMSFSNSKTEHAYLRVTDFKNGSIEQEELKFIDEGVFSKISRYTISKEDVYISIAGTTGIVGIIPESLDCANLTENAAKLVITDKKIISKEYLRYCLLIPSNQHSFKTQSMNTSVQKLALFRIENVAITVPYLSEQEKIVEKLDAIQDYKKLLLKQKSLYKELFDSVLDKSMKGEMDG